MCETWSPTLREEHSLRLFEKGVLRKILGPEREEVAGDWGRPHTEELCNLYPLTKYNSGVQIKSNVMVGGSELHLWY
jgi:hypothetical protein